MKNSNKILFFCPLPPPIGGQAIISDIVYKIIQPSLLININSRNKYFGTFKIIFNTFRIFLFYKIDLVYFTCSRSKKGVIKDVILLLLCKMYKIKVINHLHGNEVMDLFTGGVISSIILWTYKQIDTTIFVTEQQKQFIPASLLSMKRVVVPNCYDPILEEIERDFSKSKNEKSILFISYLQKSKGIFIALEVFEMIAKQYKDVTFHVAGKPLADYLMSELEVKELFESKFKKLDFEFPNRFIYHGVVEGNDKKDLFVNNDIFLFPTYHKSESFGIVNVEAMRAGNAIVTTDHNFLSNIVTKNEGLLVKPNDVNDTYNAVKYFLDNPKIMLEIQRHNIKHAKENYSSDRFNKEIKKIFCQILQE